MRRRLGFIISLCGVILVAIPLATVLRRMDFIASAVGLGFLVLGSFVALESVAQDQEQKR